METRELSGLAARVGLLFLAAVALVGCGGGGRGGGGDHAIAGVPDPPAPLPTTGNGKLTVRVSTTDGEILSGASVALATGTDTRLEKHTAADGSVVFDTLPERVTVYVNHALGVSTYSVVVAQTGTTVLDAALKPRLPRPAVARLPVKIVAGSVSADRRELAFKVQLVSSAAAPFVDSGISPVSSPYLALSFDDGDWNSGRACIVATSTLLSIPVCTSWGTSAYAVTVDAFDYDPRAVAPMPPAPGETASTLLLLDEGQRIAAWDPSNYRSFAARRLLRRLLDDSSTANAVSIAGFAGRGNAITAPQLPSLPLWLPRGSGAHFTSDRDVLQSDIAILESMTGGNSPVFAALKLATSLTVSRSPLGTRTVVALLGGGDDGPWAEDRRVSELTALQHQREDTGGRSILIVAPSKSWTDTAGRYVTDGDTFPQRTAVADLAAALHAPIVATDTIYYEVSSQILPNATYAAFDLVADLIEGVQLPSLSATFRVRASKSDAFAAGSMLRGVFYVQSQSCPFDCAEVPVAFSVRIA